MAKSSYQFHPISICTYRMSVHLFKMRKGGWYRIVVFPAASRPTIKIRISIRYGLELIRKRRYGWPYLSCRTSRTITSRLQKMLIFHIKNTPKNRWVKREKRGNLQEGDVLDNPISERRTNSNVWECKDQKKYSTQVGEEEGRRCGFEERERGKIRKAVVGRTGGRGRTTCEKSQGVVQKGKNLRP